jgi:protein TonB
MLAYAANSPKAAGRAGSPQALALILLGHAAVISAVLMAKPELIGLPPNEPTVIIDIPAPPLPPPPETAVKPQPRVPVTQPTFIDQERPLVDMGQTTSIAFDTGQSLRDFETVIGSGPTTVIDLPEAGPVRIGPRLATNENALKPPYPLDMRRAEEEATLRLKLTIDPRGRVIAVDSVGPANPSFLEAARRHILKAWRYKPATEDGVAVPSSTVINLSFRLEDV